jgi:hypothetical protein
MNGEPLIKAGGDPAFQFRKGPTGPGGFNFVEIALFRLLDGKQQDVVGPPAQHEGRFGRNPELRSFPESLPGLQCIGGCVVWRDEGMGLYISWYLV